MSNYNNVQKRRILARYTETLVNQGVDISFIFAKPLSYFDYDKVLKLIHKNEVKFEDCQAEYLFTV